MACLRLTLIRPRPGSAVEVQRLLEALDEELSGADGLIFSFVTQVETDRLGRVALWHSKEDANREATRDQILALRARLRFVSIDTQEVLMEVRSGHVPEALTGLLAGDLDVAAGTPEASLRQPEAV
jgi:hypothetical protein